jgi:hypothetical protein
MQFTTIVARASHMIVQSPIGDRLLGQFCVKSTQRVEIVRSLCKVTAVLR